MNRLDNHRRRGFDTTSDAATVHSLLARFVGLAENINGNVAAMHGRVVEVEGRLSEAETHARNLQSQFAVSR